jgi:chitinase
MPANKLVIGLPTYGHTYSLLYADQHDIGDVAVGNGIGGGWSNYPEMCGLLNESYTRVFDNQTRSPYAYNGTDWISYDDAESLAIKTHWIRTSGFAGVMVYNLNNDDWQGVCDGDITFPLIRTIAEVMVNNITHPAAPMG